ncbi:MAG TPA: hypothetical protein VLA09_09955 [Longimicrobiales bacterium]|nr:hypothetical protein [Longimicrobiales bacterium]
MTTNRVLATVLVLISAAACNTFNRGQAVRMSTQDTELNTRWHASLVSPASLAGAVQMSGSASMAPADDSMRTVVALSLANAAPGGLHPWEARLGQCGMTTDYGVFGVSDEYGTMKIDSDGNAIGSVTVSRPTPVSGDYFVAVYASDANRMVVACGNLAPPAE